MQNEVKQLEDTLEKWKVMPSVREVAPSVVSSPGLTTSGIVVSTPPIGGKKKLFSKVLCAKIEVRHTLTMKTKHNQSTEEIKRLLKLTP